MRLTNSYSSPLQSLLDLLRLRRRYSEPEARFYLTQLVGACDYMHANSVIHRDLKLGNLMLDENMDLRVGDFGLAALVKFPGERKKCVVSSLALLHLPLSHEGGRAEANTAY